MNEDEISRRHCTALVRTAEEMGLVMSHNPIRRPAVVNDWRASIDRRLVAKAQRVAGGKCHEAAGLLAAYHLSLELLHRSCHSHTCAPPARSPLTLYAAEAEAALRQFVHKADMRQADLQRDVARPRR